ncbi:hypothetical protein PtA15_10A246 [Puccinia triticina]|uniref:Uncharacterized protein n=1 Tax=Puccinia triticina TaxID=208348 RepID=A0ABY7CXH9_9BASI|nr:uncharacterized protein PtA15_10A246 [Puccinia triticina]WAQ88826.1 hypothetical protein PtA15_10A246 [Puccinia triticina]
MASPAFPFAAAPFAIPIISSIAPCRLGATCPPWELLPDPPILFTGSSAERALLLLY